MRTIADILKKAKLGDILTNNELYWKVTDLDYDGSIVATPINKDNTAMVDGFELWSTGVESVAVILNLRIVGENLIPTREEMLGIRDALKQTELERKIREHVYQIQLAGETHTNDQYVLEEFRKSGYTIVPVEVGTLHGLVYRNRITVGEK